MIDIPVHNIKKVFCRKESPDQDFKRYNQNFKVEYILGILTAIMVLKNMTIFPRSLKNLILAFLTGSLLPIPDTNLIKEYY